MSANGSSRGAGGGGGVGDGGRGAGVNREGRGGGTGARNSSKNKYILGSLVMEKQGFLMSSSALHNTEKHPSHIPPVEI